MPSWVIFSLLGTAISMAVVFVDKYNLDQQIKDYRGMAMYSAIVGLIMGTFLWILVGFPMLSIRDGFLVILTGILSIFSASLYFYVVQRELVSKVVFLLQLTPIFVFILSLIFLKETITIRQFIGFVLILIPTLLISSGENGKFKLNIDKNTFLLMLADLLTASSAVLFKFVVEIGGFTKVVAYESWGWAIGGAILFTVLPPVRKAFIETTRNLKKKALTIIFANEILYIGSKLFMFLAISLGPVFLVNVISGTQVFFGIIYGAFLTLIAPQIFKEDISKKGLIKKLILGGVTLFGISLIY